MGSSPWKGQTLQTGLNAMIGGKEVELDSVVSASQLPAFRGDDAVTPDSEAPNVVEIPQIQESHKYVAPGAFYSTKGKVKGPLYVISPVPLPLLIR